MNGRYPPGTLLSRDAEEPYHFRGPDGEVYLGTVDCTELDYRTSTFVPRVPEPTKYTWRQKLIHRIGHRLGMLRRVHHPNGEVVYTTNADAAFVQAVYGDKVRID